MDLIFVRLLFVIVVGATCFVIAPFNLPRPYDAGVGVLIGAAIVLFEWKLRKVSLKRLIGAAIGSILGICGAYLFALVIRSSVPEGHTQSFLQILVMLLMAYVGLIVGANKGDLLNLAALGGIFGGEKQSKKSYKILDTSVIIDGRIADIAETGFLDGVIVIPQFVLRELQLVADSADSLKRNRGRRGLDILQRLQKVASLNIQIVEDDFPTVREVDLKLIELAKLYEGKIITNDFNQALLLARRLDTGMVHIGDQTVNDEPQVPFGGVKGSGFGRMGGKAALDEFTELRWISVQQTPRTFP